MNKTAEPMISVVVPVYNVEGYLDQCITSLCAGKREDIEFIFINDGSLDRSADIIKRFARSDSRIRLVEKDNGGCASARNRGMDESRGKYVGFVDGDDWVDSAFFDVMTARAIDTQADIIQAGYTNYYQLEDRYERVDETWMLECLDLESGSISDRNRLIVHQPTIWRRIYRKDFLMRIGIRFPEKLPRFDDLPFQFLALWHAQTMVLADGNSYFYRKQRSGQDIGINDERLHVHFDIFELLRQHFTKYEDKEVLVPLEAVARATHKWGYEQSRPDLKDTYAALSEKCMEKNGKMLADAFGRATFERTKSAKLKQIFRMLLKR